MTDGFRNRIATNVTPVAQRDPAAFRSGIADGLAQAGDALARVSAQDSQLHEMVADSEARIAKEQQNRTRSATIADRMGAWPDVQVSIGNKLDDLRNSTDPGAPDYQAQVDRIVTDGLTQFRDSLGGDPDVVERFAPIMATFGATTRQAERRWAIGEKTKAEGAGVDKFVNATANDLLSNPTPEKLQSAMTSLDPLIDGMDVPPRVRDAVKAQKKAAYVRSFLDGRLNAGDWQGVRGSLNDGVLDAYLDPETKQNYLRQADNGEQTASHEAAMADARVKADARDAIKAVEAKVRAGIVPTPAELRVVEAQAKGAGLDDAEMIDLGALSVKATVNRSYAGQPAQVVRRDRDALAAKVAAGTASETEQVMKAQLDDLVDDADTKAAATYKDLLHQGVAGKLQILSTISGDAATRYDVAEKVDKGLGALTGLGPRAQRAALQGQETRAARPKDFGDRKTVDAAAKRVLGPIMGALGGNYGTVVHTAWNIMANGLAQNGREGFDEQVFRGALSSAMGGTLRPGGALQGGVQQVRGNPVWLPKWQTAPEFDGQLSRTDFRAQGAVYANGQPVDNADVLSHYRPTYVGDDADGNPTYHLLDQSGGFLTVKGGDPVLLTPRRPR